MEKIYFNCDPDSSKGELIPDHIVLSSSERALQDLKSRGSPYVNIPAEIEGLYFIDCEIYSKRFKDLNNEFGPMFDKLMAYAISLTWYSVIRRAYLTKGLVEESLLEDDESNKLFSTPEGYGETGGYGKSVLEEVLGDSSGTYKLAELIGIPRPSFKAIFDALYIYFMSEASNSGDSRHKLLQCLYEAKFALAHSHGEYMWKGAYEAANLEIESGDSKILSSARAVIARNAAITRHSPTREMQRQVVERYKQERALFSSKDEAAFTYTKAFPFEFSTLRGWLKNI